MARICGVYAITLGKDGRTYVGSSVNVRRRWTVHRWSLNGGRHHSRHLQRAWDKYSPNDFEFELLEECDQNQLVEREQHWIDRLYPDFNMTLVAGVKTFLGKHHTEETKRKIAATHRGMKASMETRAKMSAAHTGKRH